MTAVSIVLAGDPLPEWRQLVRAADDVGFWGFGVPDSQSLYADLYVRLTLAATTTEALRLGPFVTNPLTRHPVVTASAIASIDELSGGRAFLGIGTGDSAAGGSGLRPASLEHLERYVTTVQQLTETGSASWEGNPCILTTAARRVPVYVSASGPRSLELAGRVADGVIIGTGVTPSAMEGALASIERGAVSAGRSLRDLDLWWFMMGNVAEDDDVALDELKGSLVTYAHLAFRFTTAGKDLPPEHEVAIRTIQREYRTTEHAAFGATRHHQLADELGVTDYLADRFAVVGRPDTVVERLRELRGRGAEQVWLSVRVADKRRVLRLWNEEVRPALDG